MHNTSSSAATDTNDVGSTAGSGAAAPETLCVLMVDDDPAQCEMVRLLLSRALRSFDVIVATTYLDGLEQLAMASVDCCLVDYRLDGGRSGLDLVREARTRGVDAPVIVVTADATLEVEREAINAGATDLLVKGRFDAYGLERAIRNAIERQRITRLLRSSEHRLGAVVSNAPVIIYSVDRDGIITFIDGRGLAAFGSRSDDLVGRSLFDVYRSDPNVTDRLRSVLDGNEFRERVEIGGIHLECRTIPHFDADGNVVSAVGVCTDVTEHIVAEAERQRLLTLLDDERRRLQDLLKDLPAIIWESRRSSDGSLTTTFVSAYIEKMLGYSPEDWLSDPTFWMGRVHPDDWPLVEIPDLVLAGQTESATSYRMVRRDGSVIWVNVRFSVIRDSSGEPLGLRGIVLDVTGQMAFEQQLEDVSQVNHSIVESINAHIAVIDETGKIVLANSGWNEYGERFGFDEVTDWSAGNNYLHILAYARARNRAGAAEILEGARAVLERRVAVFTAEYQVSPIRGGQWYQIAITPLRGRPGAVVVRQDVTERRRAEEESRASQQLFESFMDNSPGLAFVKDERGRYVYVNEPFAQRARRPRQEVIGLTDFEIWPREVAEQFVANDRLVLAAGTPLTFEERSFDGDRAVIAHVVKFPIHDAAGEQLLCGEAHDVTEQLQAIDSLRVSQERFRLVARATTDIVYDWDVLSGEIWWNENLDALLGYADTTRHDIEWWKGCLHPDDVDETVADLERTLAAGAHHWSREYRLRRSDGSYAWMYERGYIMYLEGGAPFRMIGAISDRSSFVEAEDALRRSEEEYRRIVETAQEGIWVTNERGVTRFVNATLSRMLGCQPSEMIGRRFEEFLPEELHESARSNAERRRQGISEKYDLRLIRRDGSQIWTFVSASPILDHDGQLVGSLAMVTDITERKRAEDELRAARADLERRVLERTAELGAAMRRLEQAHLVQKRFVADASHDLRTPLTVVRAELDLLLHAADLPARMQDSLARASSEARRLDQLATDLLTLATLDSQEPAETADVLRLDEIILSAVQSLTPLARERGITWAITIDEPAEVRGSQLAIERAIWNVLDNAIKYSPDGAMIKVSTDTDDRWAKVTVEDEGIGISEPDLARIFERFYRSDAARSTPGTGLGLPIVKSVVESHGGFLDVSSASGEGTRVTVTLPRVGSSSCSA